MTRMETDREIELGYGRGTLTFGFDESRFSLLNTTTNSQAPLSDFEVVELLTSFVAQRLRILEHDAYDPAQLATLGTTESGVAVGPVAASAIHRLRR
jgi:hypothetical protein